MKFDEFEKAVGQVIYTSATPGEYERTHSMPTSKPPGQTVEQVIRPTGLVDPVIDIKPVTGGHKAVPAKAKTEKYPGQIFDFISEAEKVIKKGERAIATTLTKKMAEDLSEYLKEKGIKSEYLHSDIKTIDRITILTEFRRGKFDCLVGVNLLREGLDLPEVSLIGILDADKEGFLRSETSLIQTIGRAARNAAGRVILYADHMTGSLDRAIRETERRRTIQTAYNKKHDITPQTIIKKIHDITDQLRSDHDKAVVELMKIDESAYAKNPKKVIAEKERQMNSAVKLLDFETAAILRDEIDALKKKTLREEKKSRLQTTKRGI